MRVVAAVDKYKGSLTAAQVAAAIGHACWELGHDCTEVPVADGGDGTLEALGGPNRRSTVTGPLSDPVEAEWRLSRQTAIIEMARASGLALVGGREHNDAMAASTVGTGELIDQALDAGAKRIIVCLGGSATTDGGLGAVRAIHAPHRLRGVRLLVACDVTTRFTDAAPVFGPQKGASPAQVRMLTGRLERLVQVYRDEFGVDVSTIAGAGAAGGLAGALAALGGTLVPGFELVADELDLYDAITGADLVITGEGHLDAQSFEGKVVGGVQAICERAGVPVGAVVGDVDDDVADRLPVVSLVARFGIERAMAEPMWCVEQATTELIEEIRSGRASLR
ncbi:MAG: glycerate kinase [Acidimicrobiales bacterium]|nr:glycerate kinase [Acidimicrobiales bacterium]MCB9395819.1 glycerate kinase [Acidimicrobiaceae bacterium]